MSEFTAIRAVSLTLKALLKEHITDSTEPQLTNVTIYLKSPKEMREDQVAGVSLWLYRVNRSDHVLNQPPPRIDQNQQVPHPLPVNLYYLVTPMTSDPEAEQALMGRVLQVFNDHSVLRGTDLQDALKGSSDKLRLILETLSLEELTRVWNALQEPYQLSACYVVQLVTIDSDHEPVRFVPVETAESKYAQILEVT
jgi:hypothetical protein